MECSDWHYPSLYDEAFSGSELRRNWQCHRRWSRRSSSTASGRAFGCRPGPNWKLFNSTQLDSRLNWHQFQIHLINWIDWWMDDGGMEDDLMTVDCRRVLGRVFPRRCCCHWHLAMQIQTCCLALAWIEIQQYEECEVWTESCPCSGRSTVLTLNCALALALTSHWQSFSYKLDLTDPILNITNIDGNSGSVTVT